VTTGSLLTAGGRFGDYRVIRRLGKGGMGEVYLVRDTSGNDLAVKVMSAAADNHEARRRFAREAAAAMEIRHPNLVAVYDVGEDPETHLCYISMEYVSGGNVSERLAKSGRFTIREAVAVAAYVADALEAAHRKGVVHRDLKPENIMLTAEGTVKLLDLGIAKIAGGIDSLKTTAKSVFGTPAYISPEQAADSSTVDTRADVYSLGVILFELLCGHRPYAGNSPSEVLQQLLDPSPIPDVRTFNDKVSPKISAVLSLMCAKKREDRLASPKDVIDTFARLGYARPSSETEFAADEDAASAGMVQDFIPDLATQSRTEEDFTLETQDRDVQEALARLRHRRVRQRAFWVLLGVVALLLLVLAWRLLA
jgi:serine/threonine-protein kinase